MESPDGDQATSIALLRSRCTASTRPDAASEDADRRIPARRGHTRPVSVDVEVEDPEPVPEAPSRRDLGHPSVNGQREGRNPRPIARETVESSEDTASVAAHGDRCPFEVTVEEPLCAVLPHQEARPLGLDAADVPERIDRRSHWARRRLPPRRGRPRHAGGLPRPPVQEAPGEAPFWSGRAPRGTHATRRGPSGCLHALRRSSPRRRCRPSRAVQSPRRSPR